MTEQQAPYFYTNEAGELIHANWPPDTSAYAEALRLASTLEGTKWQLADALYRAVHEEGRSIREFSIEACGGDEKRGKEKEDTYGNLLMSETFRISVNKEPLYLHLIEKLDISYWVIAQKGINAGMEYDDVLELMLKCANGTGGKTRWFAAQIQTATGRAKDFQAYVKDFIHWFKNSHEFVIGGRDLMDVSEQDAKDFAYHVEKAQEIAERMLK